MECKKKHCYIVIYNIHTIILDLVNLKLIDKTVQPLRYFMDFLLLTKRGGLQWHKIKLPPPAGYLYERWKRATSSNT